MTTTFTSEQRNGFGRGEQVRVGSGKMVWTVFGFSNIGGEMRAALRRRHLRTGDLMHLTVDPRRLTLVPDRTVPSSIIPR